MAKSRYKYYAVRSVGSSDSLPRMRLKAIKAIKNDPIVQNPVNIYTDDFVSGIYPVNVVKMLPSGRFVCQDRKNDKWHDIAKDGSLKEFRGWL